MLSIILSSIAIFVFGAFWFTVLFGRTWAKEMDFNPASNDKYKDMGMVKPLIMNFFANVVIASVIYWLEPHLLTASYSSLVSSLFIVWLGFSFPIYANAAIWERKSWKLVAINSAQSLISLAIVGAIIYFV